MHWHFRALYKKTEKMKAKRSRHFPNKDSIDESARRRFFQPPEVPWRLKLSKIIFSKKLPQIIQGFERELLKFIWSWYFGMGGFTLPSNSHQKDVYLSTCLTKASSKSISGGNWHPKGYWNISDHSKHKTNCHNYKQRLFEKKNAIPNFSIQKQMKHRWSYGAPPPRLECHQPTFVTSLHCQVSALTIRGKVQTTHRVGKATQPPSWSI